MSFLPSSSAWHKPDLSHPSTGSAFDGGWQRWWAIERVRTATDWVALLRQHERVFRQLCQRHGLSS
jgi:hypothetical protein